MKTLILSTLVAATLSFTASAANAPAKNVKYVGDTQFASFCKAIVNNDVDLFKVSLNRFVGELGSSRTRVLERVLAEQSVTCDGKNLIEFSASREAKQIDLYLNKKA